MYQKYRSFVDWLCVIVYVRIFPLLPISSVPWSGVVSVFGYLTGRRFRKQGRLEEAAHASRQINIVWLTFLL